MLYSFFMIKSSKSIVMVREPKFVSLCSRTFLSIIGGVIAGILGFTGLNGFIFYFLVMAITSVGLAAKARFSIHSYFDCWNRIILDGFLSGLMVNCTLFRIITSYPFVFLFLSMWVLKLDLARILRHHYLKGHLKLVMKAPFWVWDGVYNPVLGVVYWIVEISSITWFPFKHLV